MRIAVAGLGAMGLWLAGRLLAAGQEVRCFARGATLKALQTEGLHLTFEGEATRYPVFATEDPAALGPVDLLLLTPKSQALPALAAQLAPAITPDTTVLPLCNGVPWWFLAGAPAPLQGQSLPGIDPEGRCAQAWPLDQVLGSVVHASAYVTAPGRGVHVMGKGLFLGPVVEAGAARLGPVAEVFEAAGLNVGRKTLAELRQEVWYKLWGNLTMNPLSALTGVTCDVLLADPDLRRYASAIMDEAAALGAALGCPITDSPEDRHDVTLALGAFKTSMLQDVEAGRPLELEALLWTPQKLAKQLGLAVPMMDALAGTLRVFEQGRGFGPA
jgi:2-dehydropantoate 2-reductase